MRHFPSNKALSSILALSVFLAVPGGTSVAKADTGTFQVLNGGFRNSSDNTATGYSSALGGALFERSSSSSFSSPFDLGPTNALGLASASVNTGTWYARQKTAPSGWQSLNQLHWNSSTNNYVGSAGVSNGSSSTASISGSNGNSTRFVQRLTNPNLPSGCGNGLKVLLLLDTSTSTNGYGNAYKTASNTFIDTLSGTPTKLKVSTFNTHSQPDNATQYDLSTSSGQSAAHTRIGNIYPSNNSGSGYTNWDEALQDAGAAGVDVIVMVTDGSPTIHQGGTTNSGTGIADITYAVASANHAKSPAHDPAAAGSQTIMAVGVGNLASSNLQAISGPNKGTDWTDAADPTELAQTLKEVANRICGGTLTVNKALSPQDDPGRFDLLVDSTVKASNIGDGGSTGKLNVDAGEYLLSEQAATGSPSALSDYSRELKCQDKDGPVTVGGDGTVEIKGNQDVTCTWTNTRKTGKITINKSMTPQDDPGRFDLLLNDQKKAEGVGDGGTTGEIVVPTGKHLVGESTADGSPNPLSDYNASLECKDGEEPIDSVDGKVQVDEGQNIICTWSNVRKTGKLTVQKSLAPASDPGLFDLRINGDIKAAAVGDGGTTGAQTVPTGKQTIAEDTAASSPVSLSSYNTSVACKDDQGEVPVTQAGELEVDEDQNVVCTWTNTRRAGTLQLKKNLSPVDDPGRFDLLIDDQAKASNVGDGGATEQQYALEGEHAISEAAGSESPTGLDAYKTEVDCKDGEATVPVSDGKVKVGDEQNVICIFTNTRKTGTIQVDKSLSPTDDPGLFDLKINDQTEASGVGDGGTTGKKTLPIGTYSIAEASNSGSPTTLEDYGSSLECKDDEDTIPVEEGKVELDEDQNIVCVFTNTRKAGTLTVKKSLSPTDDPGRFDLSIDGKVKAEGVGDGGSTGEQYATMGEHNVAETTNSASPTTLADYNSSLECKDGEEVLKVVDGNVQVGDKQNIVCVFLNTRKAGTLTVKKSLSPTSDPGLFDLQIDGATKAEGVGDGGTTGAQYATMGEHTVGEAANSSSPTSLTDYNTKIDCQAPDSRSIAPVVEGKVEVGDGQDVVCVITNTRKTGQLELRKSLSPTQDPGLFDLKIDGNVEASGVGNDGTTGLQEVTAGEHSLSEEANASSPTTLADYNSKLACEDGEGPVNVDNGKVEVESEQKVVCTFTNTRKAGTLTVKKSLSPTDDPGKFDLKIDDQTKAEGVGDGGTTGEQYALAGEHTVSESANASSPTTLADYNSSLECKDGEEVVSSTGGKVEVGDGQNVVCVFTNTRKAGTLTVNKSLSPTQDPGLFDLKIDGTTKAEGVGDGGTTGEQSVVAGEHTVSETTNASSPNPMELYKDTLECKDGDEVVSSIDGKVEVEDGQKIICTFTNVRKTGQVTVKKSLSPASDPGLFDLKIDDVVKASGVGDGGTTGAQTLPTGEHTVSEASNSGSPTTLANYNTSLECRDERDVVPSEGGKIYVDENQQIVCIFTNTRKAGTLTVKKSLSPTSDPGLFDLKIDGTTKAEGVGDGGTTGEQYALAGEHTVSEAANASSPTSLADYNSSLECKAGDQTVSSTDGKVEVGDGQNVVCIFTNTRKTGSIVLQKSLSPTSDPGLFDLKIDDQTKASGVGDGGSTGTQEVLPGSHLLSEAANSGSPTTLADYNSSLECKDSEGTVPVQDGKVDVAADQKVTCTFTNTRKAGTLTVNKSLSPTDDPGLFDLKIDGTTKASGVGNGGTTGEQYAVAGEHTVGEDTSASSPTTLTDYDAALECKDGEQTVASPDGKVQIADGQKIVCTFLNTRKQAVQYPLTAAVVGNGTVTSNVGGINCPGVLCNQDYDPDTVVTLVPKAGPGYVFQGWTGDCTNKTGNCVVTMSQARSVTAVFAAVAPAARFTLRTQIIHWGKGRVRATGGLNCIGICRKTYKAGTLVKLTERPKRGYYFVRWSGACRKYGRKKYCRVRMNKSQSVYALYRKIPTRPRFTG